MANALQVSHSSYSPASASKTANDALVYNERPFCGIEILRTNRHQQSNKMATNNPNTAQPMHQHMTRSQGPASVFDTEHRNPENRYIRSYNIINQQCNVNISYNTVGEVIKEKRESLATEISRLLGEYPGHWFPPAFRPRNLPLHPLDWSTVVLQDLCNFAQSLPNEHTPDQRRAAIDERMTQANHETRQSDAAAQSAGDENATKPFTTPLPDSTSSSHDLSDFERLERENQHLADQVQGLSEELSNLEDELRDTKNEETRHAKRCEKMEELEFLRQGSAMARAQYTNEYRRNRAQELKQKLGFPFIPQE